MSALALSACTRALPSQAAPAQAGAASLVGPASLPLARRPRHPAQRRPLRPAALPGRGEDVYASIFRDVDRDAAMAAAIDDADDFGMRARGEDEWFYGELSFGAWAEIIQVLGSDPGAVFLDMGSGVGKAAVAAALLGGFREVRGVEILPRVARLAEDHAAKYNEARDGAGERWPALALSEGNMFEAPLGDVDVVFCFATCLSRSIVQNLQWKLEELRPGAQVVVVSKFLDSPALELVPEGCLESSQAHTEDKLDVYLYRRT
eukprot:CAMPEP_0182906666 /NCGR_PEP_ID=MMETSP0034_2-20130328/33911_1 /TAXON_ID=156128 /ORGANISM="Nephroselmis pyriformis, Strain CCMP717" /LENGTH=261 /DNA_ID=CAMNT_0025042393 /DNA_START=87 /DNA_END=872 /DNA_ORIENTATION=-